jgi:hypothetical protein
MKFKKIIFIKGSWTHDDIDVFPNIKVRYGKEKRNDVELKGLVIALCWLKWGIGFCFGDYKLKKY